MIHKLRGYLRNIGIRTRLIFGFICVPLCMMIVFFFLYYNFSVHIVLQKNEESSQKLVDIGDEIFQLTSNKLSNELDELAQEPYVTTYVNNSTNEKDKAAFLDDLHKSSYLTSRSGLRFYDAFGTSIYAEGNVTNINIKSNTHSLTKDKTLWLYDKASKSILMLKGIYENKQRVLGYIVCEIDDNAFSPVFTRGLNDDNMLLIVGKHNEYLFGTAGLAHGVILNIQKDKLKIDMDTYYCKSKPILGTDWHVVNAVNESYILEEIHNFRNVLLFYGLAFFLVLLIISTLVYRSIYDPMYRILKSMRTLDETNLSNNRVEDYGKDELHELSSNFNDLLGRVEELLDTVKVEQEQKRETQFQLLQAQINPHFLFNTLNTLNYMAILNEDKPVSEGIIALAKLLRNTIADTNETVRVEEEIENVKNYIVIQKLRFGDEFETVYNIDDNVKNCLILKFLLQPIVENSTLHAFEEDKEHQLLTIRAKAEGMYLKIEIGDNGKGFNAKIKKNSKVSGIGMANIADRIRLMYGEQYAMDVVSVVAKGTIVTLWLPFEKEGNKHV